jgi:hypothetical protein
MQDPAEKWLGFALIAAIALIIATSLAIIATSLAIAHS